MENSCLRLHASCAENIIHDRLHASMFHHLLRCWHAHVTVGVNRPWISCCRTGRGSGGGSGGGSGCGRISCCGGNGCRCGYDYESGGDDSGSSGKFYFKDT